MTKNIIFIFAVLCSLQAQANVQPSDRDTVHSVPIYNKTELLQPIQPVYLDGVVMPIFRSGNWFVSMAGGATAFLGTPLGCEDLFGRLKPSYSFAVGKWFSPTVGARINYNGLQFKDGTLSTQEYHYVHADYCGMFSDTVTRGKSRSVGRLRLSLVSDWFITPITGIIRLLSLMACKDSIVSPSGSVPLWNSPA